jgi:hypothetical protein
LGAVALGVCGLVSVASAGVTDISTERSGSMIVFPKVIFATINGVTTDTVIQITNTGNPTVLARCFYIDASVSGECNETDFDIFLTRQQPTLWVVSEGRSTRRLDQGFPPGLVPAMPLGFQGELKCIQVDDSGAPMPTNVLKGEATLRRSTGDVSEYNAIAFQGNPQASSAIGNDISLNLSQGASGSLSGEFSACPNTLIMNHFADGVTDPVIDELGTCTRGDCPIRTELTLVPCQEDLENQVPGRVTVQFQIFNEFEQQFSASTTVACWLNAPLSRIASVLTASGTLGSTTMQTRITPNPGNGGVIGVAEEIRRDSNTEGPGAYAAFNLHTEGTRSGIDHVVLPAQ